MWNITFMTMTLMLQQTHKAIYKKRLTHNLTHTAITIIGTS